METEHYVFFYGHHPNKSGVNVFSQWYPMSFSETTYTKNGKKIIQEFVNMEQYMMAYKAVLFDDIDHFDKILNTTDPALIKQYGRKIANFKQKEWDESKMIIVTNGNKLKFGQNPELMKRLLATGNKIIVEANPHDKVWGIGLSATDAIKIPSSQWPGQNLLGKALMIVRDEHKNDC